MDRHSPISQFFGSCRLLDRRKYERNISLLRTESGNDCCHSSDYLHNYSKCVCLMNYIVLDFETDDPWINEGWGSGWPEKKAIFLCAAAQLNLKALMNSCHLTSEGSFSARIYTTTQSLLSELKYFVEESYEPIVIVAHNAQYEAGILHSYGFDIESVTWIDTAILAKLFYNNLHDFSLNSLAKIYLLKSLRKIWRSFIRDVRRQLKITVKRT